MTALAASCVAGRLRQEPDDGSRDVEDRIGVAEELEVAAREHAAMLAGRRPAIRIAEDAGAAAVMRRGRPEGG